MNALPDNADDAIDSVVRILVADDDADALGMLVPALQRAGYIAVTAGRGLDALRALFAYHPDLVILSLSLPGMDIWTVLERMREVTETPILIVSSQRAVGLRLRAFELRAQDFITKPFHPDEFVLRVKAALQRSALVASRTHPMYDDGILCIDGRNRDVKANGQPLNVTVRELDLLLVLARQPGRLVSYNDLAESLPWLSSENGDAVLRSAVYRLRQKLALVCSGHCYLVTQRDVGIRLNTRQSTR